MDSKEERFATQIEPITSHDAIMKGVASSIDSPTT